MVLVSSLIFYHHNFAFSSSLDCFNVRLVQPIKTITELFQALVNGLVFLPRLPLVAFASRFLHISILTGFSSIRVILRENETCCGEILSVLPMDLKALKTFGAQLLGCSFFKKILYRTPTVIFVLLQFFLNGNLILQYFYLIYYFTFYYSQKNLKVAPVRIRSGTYKERLCM